MRTIKFRAWIDTPNIRLDGDKAFMTYQIDDLDFESKEIYFDSNMAVLFDECKLMQWTGLKDKNGKEIYEGDIVTYAKGNTKRVVEWNEEKAGWTISSTKKGTKSPPFYTIIGNIYENPELLTPVED